MMTENEMIVLCFGGSIFLIILVLATVCVWKWPEWKAQHEQHKKQVEEEYAKEPEYKFINARVLTKSVSAYYASFRQPKQLYECKIVFLTETGEEKEVYVSKEVFESIEENQEGTLVTVNGNFFDFGDGEEIEGENV